MDADNGKAICVGRFGDEFAVNFNNGNDWRSQAFSEYYERSPSLAEYSLRDNTDRFKI